MAATEKPKSPASRKRRMPQTNRHGVRPGSKLTRKLGGEICARIAKGVPIAAASRASGVSENTVFEWVRRGLGEDDRPRTALTEWFAGEYSRSLAGCHAELVEQLREGTRTEPRLLMFMLERRFPEDWGRREIQRHEGVVDHTVRVELAFDATPEPVRDGYARRAGAALPAATVTVELDPSLVVEEAS